MKSYRIRTFLLAWLTIAFANTPMYSAGMANGIGLPETNKAAMIALLEPGFRHLGRMTLTYQPPAFTDVLLVHGIFSNDKSPWTDMRPRLEEAGYTVSTLNFQRENETLSSQASIKNQALALSNKIKSIPSQQGHTGVALICHSMGGLAARWYLNNPTLWPSPTSSGVVKLIMLGTANWGTDIELQNPILGVTAAHLAGRDSVVNVDKLDAWSQAFKDMFAEWQPVPLAGGGGRYRYPDGYRLSLWPQEHSIFRGPMIWPETPALVDAAKTLPLREQDRMAVRDAESAFALLSEARRTNQHIRYYTGAAGKMESLHASLPGLPVRGVNARRISPFLHDLNVVTSDRSCAQIYIVAGSLNVVPLAEGSLQLNLPGPFASTSSDGLLPVDSVLVTDPISGSGLSPNLKGQKILNIDHSNLPHFPAAIDSGSPMVERIGS
ncbi:MAG TPA: hypothetical protein VFA07_17365 [Chthonomonadaceae bacterium]|nr:hypothetical protein [Chthonomonadaceae bacterium]